MGRDAIASLDALLLDLKKVSNTKKIADYQRFFKTGEGEYGEGDIFIGVTVPNSRKVARKYKGLSLVNTVRLLKSKIHEERLVALLILVEKFQKGTENEKNAIFDKYLSNTKYINNWDLVDLSAHKVVGAYLFNRDKSILNKLAKSNLLWDRRIAIMTTFWFIRNGYFDKTLEISEILLEDQHDLIHKAVGWMLREIGKKDQAMEEKFLKKHYKIMPRTMLRYAIEKFPEDLRQKYLKGMI